ncbi:MAG: 50S ribosomal protein L4 [Armatimonadetes bacterium]|nr:50S ribosomal protein L4 [Armatimonadota bacterium]NIM24254.1 50S ribosomal protein L4 [Armatimonadota bacterium]NIM68123.1 50S ribosomal protein L4 [Armatimonadota bacterium]NIM76585.1 50S ribosomal protein L4 [Armatimonadota bacterium]NIN06328.1 50S ribosomal protein L4 [Armatimonadota bacterium]
MKKAVKKKVTLPIFSRAGEKVGDVEVTEALFAAEVKPHLLHTAAEAYLANQRQGTTWTKTRSEVSGSTAKLFRQKGTGRARAGSRRSPTRVGGGAAFGPQPRDYRRRLPKKVRRQALCGALSSRAAAGDIRILESLELEKISTKAVVALLEALGLEEDVLLITDTPSEVLRKSARNLRGLMLARAEELNAYEVMRHHHLLFTKEGLSRLQEVMG